MPCVGKAARVTGCRKIYSGPLAGARGAAAALLPALQAAVCGRKLPELLLAPDVPRARATGMRAGMPALPGPLARGRLPSSQTTNNNNDNNNNNTF